MYICLCVPTTRQQVIELAAHGLTRTKEVADRCGAGSVCGKCRNTIRAVLHESAGHPAGPDRPARLNRRRPGPIAEPETT